MRIEEIKLYLTSLAEKIRHDSKSSGEKTPWTMKPHEYHMVVCSERMKCMYVSYFDPDIYEANNITLLNDKLIPALRVYLRESGNGKYIKEMEENINI